jgi:serine O-acetyltransferase
MAMITSKKEYLYFLEQDGLALGIQRGGMAPKIRKAFSPDYVWKFEKLMRKLEYLTNTKQGIGGNARLLVARIAYSRLSVKLGFSIPINVFDAGLSIAHYGTIIVNSAAVVGKNCRLHAGVNIGATGGQREAPQIGDNVYIGPGAIIFGKISIANNITIGANATVNKSFSQEGVVLAGTPAKIVKENCPVWWKKHKLPLAL